MVLMDEGVAYRVCRFCSGAVTEEDQHQIFDQVGFLGFIALFILFGIHLESLNGYLSVLVMV